MVNLQTLVNRLRQVGYGTAADRIVNACRHMDLNVGHSVRTNQVTNAIYGMVYPLVVLDNERLTNLVVHLFEL